MSENEAKFCKKCGVQASPTAAFCSSCGTPMGTSPHAQTDSRMQWKEYRYARRSGDKSAPVVGGLVVLWLGISLYFGRTAFPWWALFLIGVGVILIASGLLRWSEYKYRYPPTGFLIGGGIILIIGLAGVAPTSIFGPAVLVAVGLVIIVFGAYSMRNKPQAQSTPTPPAQT